MTSLERDWELDGDLPAPVVQLWAPRADHLGRPGFMPTIGHLRRATMFALHVRMKSSSAISPARQCPAIAVLGADSDNPLMLLVQPSQPAAATPREVVLAFVPDDANPDALTSFEQWLMALE
jgi:hypothetical protein